MTILIWFFCWGLLLMPTAHAGETLLIIYQQAKAFNPSLQSAKMDYLSREQARKQIKALQKPNVNLGVNYSYAWDVADDVNGDNQGYQLSAKQALFNRPDDLQLQQMDTQMTEAKVALALAEQELMLRLASRYFDVLSAQADLTFSHSAQQVAKRQLAQTEQQLAVGLIAITQVHESKAYLDQSTADEIQDQALVDNAYEALSEETGRDHQGLLVYPDLLDSPQAKWLQKPVQSVEKWTQKAMEHNLPLHLAQLALQNALQEIKRHRSKRLPTLDLLAQHAYSEADNNTLSSGYHHDNSLSLQLNWQLYSGGAVTAQITQAEQEHEKALFLLEKQQRLLKRQLRQAYLSIVSTTAQTQALQQALLSTETAYQAVKAEFDVGTRTTVDVLNAQRDFLNAQRNFRKAKYRFLLETLNLKQAAGLLTEDALAEVSASLFDS